MKVGDLVKKNYKGLTGSSTGLGIIIEVEQFNTGPRCRLYRVKWQGDYGAFFSSFKDLKVISEAR